MTTRYVAGFAFYEDLVALILKKKGPRIVIGKLNAVGGHYEESDLNLFHATAREFQEETGVMTSPEDWIHFCDLAVQKYDAIIHFMYTRFEVMRQLVQMTEEPVAWYYIKDVPTLNVVPNLNWLIPLALADQKLFANVFDTTT